MCLELYAVPATEGQVGAERLARVSGLRVRKYHSPGAGAFHFSRDGGCLCSLMTDAADWKAPVWTLAPDVLAGLVVIGEPEPDADHQYEAAMRATYPPRAVAPIR